MEGGIKMLEIGNKCKWANIKIGEVFAFQGCWSVLCKVSENEVVFLDSDQDWSCREDVIGERRGECFEYRTMGGFIEPGMCWKDGPFGCSTEKSHNLTNDFLYRLPKEIQALWKG